MSKVQIAQHLFIDQEISDQFSFQPLPELGIEESVVCFWEEEQVSFILSVDEQPAFSSHQEHWTLLQDSLKKEFGSLKVKEQGEYESEYGSTVSFHTYEAGTGDDQSLLIYHLISNGKVSYWIVGTLLFCSDSEAVNPIIMSVLETAKMNG